MIIRRDKEDNVILQGQSIFEFIYLFAEEMNQEVTQHHGKRLLMGFTIAANFQYQKKSQKPLVWEPKALIWVLEDRLTDHFWPIGPYDGDDSKFMKAFMVTHQAAFMSLFVANGWIPREVKALYKVWTQRALQDIKGKKV